MTNVSIVVGTVYGSAEQVALLASKMIVHSGGKASIFLSPEVVPIAASDIILVICSTTGQGDIPENMEALPTVFTQKKHLLDGKRYATIALGDSGHGEYFCMGGRKVDSFLSSLGCVPVCERLEIDSAVTLDVEQPAETWLAELIPIILTLNTIET